MIPLNQPYYYNNLKEDACWLGKSFPQYVKTSIIGLSHDNRDIIMLRVGKGNKSLILTGGVHGRESVNPIVLMKMMEYYCNHAFTFLDYYTFYVVPMVNPDGYMIAQKGFDVIRQEGLRKKCEKMRIPSCQWKYNARAVDINRNFPCRSWRPKSPFDYPVSEFETKALIDVFDSIPSVGYIDYHSRGKSIYYYRGEMDRAYNQRQKIIGERLADDLGYGLMLPEEEIDTEDSGGNTVHYYSERKRKPAITIETVEEDATFPLAYGYQGETFQEILFSPLIMFY